MKKKVALFSYNAFISDGTNGWNLGINNDVLLVQDPEGRPWGTQQSGISKVEMAQESVVAIESGWEKMASELPNLDMFYIYVGSYGAERAIELARQNDIPPEKVAFVMCNCGLTTKMAMIKKCGYEDTLIIGCECGGRSTMAQLYRELLKD